MLRGDDLNKQRHVLLLRIEKMLEGPMIFLGFVWLLLLLIELIRGLNPLLEIISITIWIIFILDFAIKLFLAPHKGRFIKKNWLTVISLIIPALRVIRIVRVVRLLRGLRSIRLVKILASVNRSMKSLGATMKRRGFTYVFLLTIGVVLAGAAGMFAFEKDAEGGLKNYGQALWWTAMLVITIGSEYWPQTPEGRALCFLIAVYGFSIFGYITATLASFFVGRDAEEKDAPIAGSDEVASLRKEIELLSKTIFDLKSAIEKGSSDRQ